MVDTLAPKKIFTQRELGKSLTPSPVAAAIMQPAKNIMDMSPDQKMPGGVIEQQSDFLVDPNSIMASMQENQAPGTMEREQTIRSSEETTADKQTGERADRQTTQGLASRPGIMYANTPAQHLLIHRPLLLRQRDPEMIVPTGKNKFTVLSTDDLKGLMARVDLGSKLSDEDELKQRDKFYELGRDDYLVIDQYLGTPQAFRDAED